MQNSGAPTDDINSPLGEFSAGTDYLNTGKMGDQWGTGLPLPVTMQLLQRGQREFTINCAVCHGATGQGNGITSKYGLLGIADLHHEKYLPMADGQIFDTISHGHNTMMAYGDKVTVKDRWAIIAYIRALQKSQNARLEDVPEDQRAALENEDKPPSAPQPPPPGQPAKTETTQTR
jgi:mono/diheme cytochrome c family protein